MNASEHLTKSVSEFKNEVRPVAERLAKSGQSILKGCELVGRSWSASFAGYHARLYYKNFQPPPLQHSFSPEWGGINGLPEGWHQRTPEEVREAIEKLISQKFSIEEEETLARNLAERANDLRTVLLDRFSDAMTTSRIDRILSEIKQLSFGGVKNNYVKAQLPSGLITRDSEAALQGICIPSHTYYEGAGAEIEAVSKSVLKFIKLLDRLDESISNATPTMSDSAAATPLATLHPEIRAKCEKLYRDGAYPEAVEKSFKIVRDRLRNLTGHETGAKAFGRGNAVGKSLYIKGAAALNVERDFNEAVKFLTMAIDNFRNEKSHTSDAKIEYPIRAYEYLGVASLALHLLDGAELVDVLPWETSGS